MTPNPRAPEALLRPTKLLGWGLGLLAATATLGTAGAMLIEQPDWARGIVASALSVAGATVLTARIVCVAEADPTRQTMRLLTGGLVRFFAAIAGALLAILLAKTPALPTLISLVPLYIVVLTCESILLHRALWKD
jgi:hypothetical protein